MGCCHQRRRKPLLEIKVQLVAARPAPQLKGKTFMGLGTPTTVQESSYCSDKTNLSLSPVDQKFSGHTKRAGVKERRREGDTQIQTVTSLNPRTTAPGRREEPQRARDEEETPGVRRRALAKGQGLGGSLDRHAEVGWAFRTGRCVQTM